MTLDDFAIAHQLAMDLAADARPFVRMDDGRRSAELARAVARLAELADVNGRVAGLDPLDVVNGCVERRTENGMAIRGRRELVRALVARVERFLLDRWLAEWGTGTTERAGRAPEVRHVERVDSRSQHGGAR